VLQLLSLTLYTSSSIDSPDRASSDPLGAVAVKPLEDEVDSEDMDNVELLSGIDDENVREAFRVHCEVLCSRALQ